MELKNLQQAILHFDNPQNCVDYVVRLRWPDGKVKCPTCGSDQVTWIASRWFFQCKARHPKRQFSVKVGTVMEESPIALGKWLLVGWMLANCRNGISSHEVARTIGITQKSAWFMLHRLREAAQDDPQIKLYGDIEADETFVGGKVKNMHKSRRPKGTGYSGKPVGAAAKVLVLGMVERQGRIKACIIPDREQSTIHALIDGNMAEGSTLITDEWGGYKGVSHRHEIINHADAFVRGSIHTNTIENFWSLLKRSLAGTYISVQPKHLQAYIHEQAFRYNTRKKLLYSEQQRFSMLIDGTTGKRLTYAELTA